MQQIPWEVDEWGCNALHYAAEAGHWETVVLLLDINFDPSLQDRSGHTALMLAAQEARADIVALLLARHAEHASRLLSGPHLPICWPALPPTTCLTSQT